MKGITEELNFFIKIITIIVLVLSILGAYFAIIEYDVVKNSAGIKREALIIADSFLSCKDIRIDYSLLNQTELDLKNKTKLNCLEPYNDMSEVVVNTGSNTYAFGNMGIDTSKSPNVTYAVSIKTTNDIVPGIIKVYLG